MKLINENLSAGKESRVTLQAQDKEDIWLLYNIIQQNDRILVTTMRNVAKEGSNKVEKHIVKLLLKVVNVEFDPESNVLRCKGRSINENKFVPLNSYHTAVIDAKYAFSLIKDEFDQYSLDQIHKATNVHNRAEIGAIVLQEGIAHFCLITESMRILVAKVEKSIPKKRRINSSMSSTAKDTSGYDKAVEKFLNSCNETFLSKFDMDKLKVVLIAAPGDIGKKLYDLILSKAQSNDNKSVTLNKQKLLLTYASNGYLQSLDEVMSNPEILAKLQDTKYVKDSQLLEKFFEGLNRDDGTCWYGKEECTKAVYIVGAVKNLLLTDTLFRSDDVKERKFYIALSDKVKEQGGEVSIFSSLHGSGEQLDKITGVAVILNYPMHGLDDSDEED